MCNESKLEVVLVRDDSEGDGVLCGSASASEALCKEYVSKQKPLTVM